jgi:Zn-dependent protease
MFKVLAALLMAGKLGKVLLTGGTMLISVVAYAFCSAGGMRWASVAIFVHEMGHLPAARQHGLAVGAPTFIPFVGAWIQLKDQPHDVETEAYIGMAGPVLGTLGALACYFLARSQDSALLLALSYAGFFINLFNLIPLSPFDGGRITAIISPRMWLVGVPILAALFFYRPSPMLILIAVLAAPQVMKALKYDAAAPENVAYYGVKLETKVIYAAFYIGLAAFLAIMAHDVHEMLGGLQAMNRG